ncbi:MAG: GNAT family N-acetyltransferase [Clostridia bacterium]|nr:GNAT family N-acetyltransferase [Clostridia bacterium]
MCEIGRAASGDAGEVRRLFSLCFDEPAAYTAFYLEHGFRPARTALLRRGGHVCAMLTMIPAGIGGLRGSYLYGVATDPACRGQGLMRRLIGWAAQTAADQDEAFLLLAPANRELARTYGRMGFTPFSRLYEEKVPAQPGLPYTVADEDAFVRLRAAYLRRIPGAVAWDEAHTRYLYREAVFCGGGVRLWGEKPYYAVYLPGPAGVCVAETDGPAVQAAAAVSPGAAVTVRSRLPQPGAEEAGQTLIRPTGAAPLPAQGYAALLLDI